MPAPARPVPGPPSLRPAPPVALVRDLDGPHVSRSGRFVWHPPATAFADLYNIPADVVEAAADNPSRVELDPGSARAGHRIEARRRGDITVIVGCRDEDLPAILYVRLHLPGRSSGGGAGRGGGGASDAPTTLRGLRARIVADGFVIRAGGRHDRVETPDGQLLATLPSTPSDRRSIPNTWSAYRHARDHHFALERVRAGALLDELSGPGSIAV